MELDHQTLTNKAAWQVSRTLGSLPSNTHKAVKYLQIGEDQSFLDFIPDDASHFITVQLHNGTGNFDTLAGSICK